HLENLVAQEMQSAVEREQAIQLVLDSMGDGLLVCDRSGRLTPIRSKTISSWFGEPVAGAHVWDYLAGGDEDFRESFAVGFEQLAADEMPFDVCAQQMPQRARRGGRDVEFDYRQVVVDEVFTSVVVGVRDITAELAAERAERVSR